MEERDLGIGGCRPTTRTAPHARSAVLYTAPDRRRRRRCLRLALVALTATALTAATLGRTGASPSAGAIIPANDGGATAQIGGAGPPLPTTLAADASPEFRAVAEAVQAAMQQLGVPGVSLGIYANGREEAASFGVVDLTTNTPVTDDTRFAVGSINKTHTATAVMRLVEQGRIDLDAPVRRYVPELRLADASVAEQVTVRHLMTHTGGWWGDSYVDTGDGDDAIARFVAEHLPTVPQLAPLGAFASYNNAGYTLLGRVVETVTGMPYRAAMQQLVLDPLGLTHATFDPAVVLSGPHTTGYGPGPAGVEAVTPLFLPRHLDPAGGMWATIHDQLRYARFHLGDGTTNGQRVMRRETLTRMQTPAMTSPTGGQIGLYWGMSTVPGSELKAIGHNGQTFTHTAELTLIPERGFAIATLTNHGGEAAVALTGAALRTALAQYLGVEGSAAPPEAPAPVTMSAERLAQYTGRYETPTDTIVLRVQDGGLTASYEKHNPSWQLVPSNQDDTPLADLPVTFVADDVALVVSDPSASISLLFLRAPDGGVGWLVIENRLHPRVAPV